MKNVRNKSWTNIISKLGKIDKIKMAYLISLAWLLISNTSFASILFDIEQRGVRERKNKENTGIERSAFGQNTQKNQKIESRFFVNIKNQPNNHESILKSACNNNDFSRPQFSKDYELILFYSHSCIYCKNFVPTLKKYSDEININVKGIIIGGDSISQELNYFPNFSDPSDKTITKQEIIERFFDSSKNITVPTLFIQNKKNFHVYPVSQGALTYLELVRKMDNFIPKILNKETILKNEAAITGKNHV